ncbi:MAG: hypothetical protein V2I54_00695 [Bacteroidales bacterium]|jgi:hypothetical protein|nr:hypothetical protein [Bacteroidales bacterium]
MKTKDLKYILFLWIAAFASVYTASAQEVRVQAKLDTNQALIGDQVVLNLSVFQNDKDTVLLPVFEKRFSDQLEVIEQFAPDTLTLENDRLEIKQKVLITAFDSGHYVIQPVPFLYRGDTLTSDALLFKVNTVPVDTTKAIKDIKKPYEAPVTLAEIYPWLFGGLGLILLILMAIYVLRKILRKEPILRKAKPQEPAHVIAYRDLEKLKGQKLWQKEQVKEYYTQLTDILRKYLWNRYAIRTLERTSDEILQSLKDSPFYDEQLHGLLKDIFNLSDLVKFAKFKPLPDEHQKCYNDAIRYVDETKLEIVEDDQEDPHKTDNKVDQPKPIEQKLKQE